MFESCPVLQAGFIGFGPLANETLEVDVIIDHETEPWPLILQRKNALVEAVTVLFETGRGRRTQQSVKIARLVPNIFRGYLPFKIKSVAL